MTRRCFWATLAAPLVPVVVPLSVRTAPQFIAPRVPPMAEVWVVFEKMLG